MSGDKNCSFLKPRQDPHHFVVIEQEVSDGSDTEYSEQYHHVKPTFVPTTMQERTHVYLAPPASHQKPPPPTAAGTKPANIPNIACPHCDKKFMRGYNMRVHIDRVHNKVVNIFFLNKTLLYK